MEKEITLKPLFHRQQECIGIYFEYDLKMQFILRQTGILRYSKTHKCWYTPLSREHYDAICAALKGIASIEKSGLRQYLLKKKTLKQSVTIIAPDIARASRSNGGNTSPGKAAAAPPAMWIRKQVVVYKREKISPVNAHVIPAMEEYLKLRAYSPSTIRTYLGEMSQLLALLKDIPADDLTPAHMSRYFLYCFEKLHLKENTLHSRINALKFYYEQVLEKEKFFWHIPRPKKPLILPKLLNENELARLFNALKNKKHKAILFTAYSAGLRVSEVVNLRIADIDSRRMQIFVGRAKGKKDRYVNLSPVLLDILRSYIKQTRPVPREYLFESEVTGTAYPARTVQQLFSNAKHKAGIRKEVGIHSLRHSFATHLLDKGTDIRYIKDLLGHFDLRTTERYLHVTNRQLVNVISPFDDLYKREVIDW